MISFTPETNEPRPRDARRRRFRLTIGTHTIRVTQEEAVDLAESIFCQCKDAFAGRPRRKEQHR